MTADDLIVPGKRIGPIRFGMTVQQVIDALGQPEQIDRDPDGLQGSYSVYAYDGAGLAVKFSHPPSATAWTITARDSRYRTAQDVGVGSSGQDVHRVFGEPTRTHTFPAPWNLTHLDYRALGLYIAVSAENVVESFAIQKGVWREVGRGRFIYVPAL